MLLSKEVCRAGTFSSNLIVFFFSAIFRNRAIVSLFWDFWAPQRLPSDHKIGRKLPFGKKHHLMGFRNIQEDDCLKEEFQDEPVLAHFKECP